MSILPMSGGLPVLFLEARMLGQPTQVVSQLGLSIVAPECSVAVLSRASGVLLVAGVGSYCVYRICTKYLGRRFVWMLLDSSRVDQLGCADIRLLYPTQIHPTITEIENEDETEGDQESENEWRSRVSGSRTASEMSVSRLQRIRRSTRGKGLLAIRQTRSPKSGVLRREGNSMSGSVMNIQQRAASSLSDCSASLRIVWEGQQTWDDEFAEPEHRQPSTVTRVGNTSSTSHHNTFSQREIQAAPSMGDLCSVFDDILSVTSRDDHLELQTCEIGDETFLGEDCRICEEEEERDTHSNRDLLRLKCMTDSKYMYQSVCVGSDFDTSEAGSMISIRSSASNLHSLKKRLNKTVKPIGLWDLSPDDPSTSTGSRVPNPMTDSGLSSGLRSEVGKSQKLFDSALGADIFSSEDEGERERMTRRCTLGQIPDEVERSSISPSQMSITSLEWFDEGLREVMQEDFSSEYGVNIPLPIVGLDLDFELLKECPIGREKHDIHKFLTPPNFHRRPLETRHLMVFAREKLQPYSEEIRKMQSLHDRCSLKRVGLPVSNFCQMMSSFLQSALYHDVPFLAWKSKECAMKRLSLYYNRYNVLHRWNSHCTKDSGLNTLQQLQCLLGSLWDLVLDPRRQVDEECTEALRLLLLLRSIDIFEMERRHEFSWFIPANPTEAAGILKRNIPNEMVWRLLAWACNVRFEVINLSPKLHSSQIKHQIGDLSAPVQYWLSLQNQFYPLFYVPDH